MAKKISDFEIKSGHVQSPCVHEFEGVPCNESLPSCVLFVCEICGGAEGTLTTHCSGRKMDTLEHDQVFNGTLNFENGRWIDTAPVLSCRKCKNDEKRSGNYSDPCVWCKNLSKFEEK